MATSEKKKELSRADVSYRLGCSQTQIMRFESEGKLNPRRENGRVWHDPEEVSKLAQQWKPKRTKNKRVEDKLSKTNLRGSISKIALPMFAQNRSLAEICVAAEADPLIIQQLYERWKLGLEGALERTKKERLEAEEREAQRDHDKREERRQWREYKLRLAQIESQSRKSGT